MPSRPVRAFDEGADREPKHSDLMAALQAGLAASDARAEERHNAVLRQLDAGDERFVRIEASVAQIARDQAEAKGAAEAAKDDVERLARRVEKLAVAPEVRAGAGKVKHNGGITFEHGWRSWLAVSGIGLAALAALKGALMALDWVGGGVAAAWQYLTHH